MKRGDCLHCGGAVETRGAKYCKSEPCQIERGKRQREATAAANRERWELWKAAGIDPTHGGSAAEKRAAAVRISNTETPRRRKTRQ